MNIIQFNIFKHGEEDKQYFCIKYALNNNLLATLLIQITYSSMEEKIE